MALKELRGATRGWIFKVFVFLLICSFGAWGVQDIFKTASGRGVAKVGGSWITVPEFQDRLRTAAERLSKEEQKPVSLDFVQENHLPVRVVDQMVNERTLDIYADRLRLATSDESLSRIIRGMQAFQGAGGQFDQAAYVEVLRANNLQPTTFETALRGDIVRSQLASALTSGATLPQGLFQDLLAFQGEMREVSYVLIDPSLAGDIPAPDDATLQKYVAANKTLYSAPELRTFAVLMMRPDDFAARVPVTAAELQDAYKANIAAYTTPEHRSEREISFPDEASAAAAMKALQSHAKTFEQVGHERGLKDDALAFKSQAQTDIADPEVGKAVFAARTPGLVGPVNGALAYTVAEFKDVVPEKIKPFDDVKADLQKSLGRAKADDLISAAVNTFEDARAGGSTFEEIAQKQNIPIVKYTLVDATGHDRSGKQVVTGPEAAEILKAAFQDDQGADNDPQPLSTGGQFVVRVDNVTAPAVRPFAEVAQQARADYEARERAARLTAKTDALIAAHTKDGLGAVASELGVPAATLPTPLRRGAPSDVLSGNLAQALFDAKPQTLVAGNAAQGGKMIIATVLKVDRPSPQEIAQGIHDFGPQLNGAAAQDLTDAFVGAARAKLNAKIIPAAVDQATTSARF